MPRPANPDRLLAARLTGIAGHHVAAGTPTEEAVAELRALANGRTDLLAQVAGAALGAVDTSLNPGWLQREAELCIAAGADQALIPAFAAEVRQRLASPRHQSHG